MDTFVYIMNFIKDKNIASITPTSSVGVKKVCSKIDFSREQPDRGIWPWNRRFFKIPAEKMREDSRLILIERNKNFNSILHNKIA